MTIRRLSNRADSADRIGRTLWSEFTKSDGRGASVACDGSTGCPDHGYLASYAGHERQYGRNDFTDFHVCAYVDDHSVHVGSDGRRDYYGLWASDDIVFCDISRHFDDRDECLKFAESNGQIAIFDCANKCDIDLRYA